MARRGKPWRERLSRCLSTRRARLILAATYVLFAGFCVLSGFLFVFPATGMPARVDAIVVLGGTGDRLDLGVRLAHEDKAPYLVLSEGLPGFRRICAVATSPWRRSSASRRPRTTQGEAEGAAKMAKKNGWTSMVVVTTRDQVWRAHRRFQRCYSGQVYGVAVPIPWYAPPDAIVYQWAGTAKAETYQRGC